MSSKTLEDVKDYPYPVVMRRLIDNPNIPNRLMWDSDMQPMFFNSKEDADAYIKEQGGRGWRYYGVFTHRLYHMRGCGCGDCPTDENRGKGENKYRIGWDVFGD